MQNEIIPKKDIITEEMICDCIINAGLDYNEFKEDLQKQINRKFKNRFTHCSRNGN